MSLRRRRSAPGIRYETECHTPHAQELNVDVNTECPLEGIGHLPPVVVRLCVHFVCEWDLLMVTCREETDFVKHSSEAVY